MRASDLARRRLLGRLLAAASVTAIAALRSRRAQAADLPLLDPASAAARKLGYVSDASRAKSAPKGSSCSSCGLYQGASGSQRGPCPLFPGRAVAAGGWCSSWQPQM